MAQFDFNKIMTDLAASRQSGKAAAANLPQPVTQDPKLAGMRSNRDEMVRALYDEDKRMADRYANPESEMFIRNPYNRAKALSGQHQQEMGSIQNIEGMISNRKDTLERDLLKGLEIYKMGLEASKFEQSSLMDELSGALDIAKFEQSVRTEGQGAGTSGERATEKALKQLQTDIGAYGKFDELVQRYAGEIPEYQIRAEYNKGPGASIWGPATESAQDVSRLVEGPDRGGLTDLQTSNIRGELAGDISEAKLRGLDRSETIAKATAVYPELADEIQRMFDTLWPEEGLQSETETGGGNFLQDLIDKFRGQS